MNAKRIIPILTGFFIYFVATVMLTGYGNKVVHPNLNVAMFETFLLKNNKGSMSMPKYTNYKFRLDQYELLGTAIIKSGLFLYDTEEGDSKLTGINWIKNGGDWADVPMVPASLRHFYDPTQKEGERYLQDTANARLMGFMQSQLSNPKTDGVEWAIRLQEHQYNWENGKLWLKKAFEESNQTMRDKYMAAAWRSLGETLHMIADNGCPSHVRNDAHPSPVYSNNSIFGNPDPYEEYMENLIYGERDKMQDFMKGSGNPDLMEQFDNAKTIYEIAHRLALFTNRNFFTSETISGLDRFGNKQQQIIQKYRPYTSPLLNNMSYQNGYYTSTVAPYTVKHCSDISYWADIFPSMRYPYIDLESVRSQAQALLPNIVKAGAYAINLFIPSISVEIKSAVQSNIKGVVKHKPNEEYKHEIKYNGEVNLVVTDKNYKRKQEKKGVAIDGNFEIKEVSMEIDDKLVAEIYCGGIIIFSNEFIVTEEENEPENPDDEVGETIIEINPNPAKGKTGNPITFNAQISGPAPDSAIYKWNFGDGTENVIIYGDSVVTHTYKHDGEYNIMLELYDNSGFITEAYSKAIITSNSNVLPSGSQSIILNVSIADADFGELKYTNDRIEYPLLWGGNSFSVEYELPERVGFYKSSKLSIKGTLSDDGESVASITAISEFLEKENQNGHSFINSEVRISNIPFGYLSESNEYDLYVYQLNGKEIKNNISYLSYHNYYKTWGIVSWDIQHDRDSFTYECGDCFLSSITISFAKYK